MRSLKNCATYFACLVFVSLSVGAARFEADKYKYKNFYYRKSGTKKLNILLENLLEAHPTEKDILHKAKSLEKFLFDMPDPSVNGGYRQLLREQRKQGEDMDIQMKKSRNEMRERALQRIFDKNANIADEEGKLLKRILECRGNVKTNRGSRLGVEHVIPGL